MESIPSTFRSRETDPTRRHRAGGWGARIGSCAVGVLALSGVLPSAAQTAKFDFDTAAPVLTTGRNLPFTQTAGGISVRFSNVTGAFSVQTDRSTGFVTSFSGKYLYPNSLLGNVVRMQFSQELTDIALTFATTDQSPAAVTPLTLNAYLATDSATNLVGSSVASAVYARARFPMGTNSYSPSSKTFNYVELRFPATAKVTYFIDDVVVTAVPALAIQRGTNSVVLSWPVPSTGFVLQENVSVNPAAWVTVKHTPENEDGRYQVTVAPATGTGFYRLVRP